MTLLGKKFPAPVGMSLMKAHVPLIRRLLRALMLTNHYSSPANDAIPRCLYDMTFKLPLSYPKPSYTFEAIRLYWPRVA